MKPLLMIGVDKKVLKQTEDETFDTQIVVTVNPHAVKEWKMYGTLTTIQFSEERKQVMEEKSDDLNEFLLEVFKHLSTELEEKLDKAITAWLGQKGL